MPNADREKRNQALRRRRAKLRAIIEEIKNKPCQDCGGIFHPFVMDLDHRDPLDKFFNVSAALPLGFGEDRIREEAAKCDVVCSNCHRMRTLARKQSLPLGDAIAHKDKTHCPQGHPYDTMNTRYRRRFGLTHRECITCVRAYDRSRKK